MKEERGPEIYAFFVSYPFIEIAHCAIPVFFGESSLNISPGKSTGYRPTGSSCVLSSMDLVKSLLCGNRADPQLCVGPSRLSAALHMFPTIKVLLHASWFPFCCL